MSGPRAWGLGLAGALAILLVTPASAQERGFRTDRYEGTSAGSALFLVERPWYSGERYAAAGVTLEYSHRVLEPRLATGRGAIAAIVDQALVGHLDLAGSLFDRVLLSASLPVSFLEQGTIEPVSQAGPLQTIGVGDPRVGVRVRLWGQPERDAFSVHLGADVWIPIGAQSTHQGDAQFRLLPRVVLAGAFGLGRWTLDAGFLYRSYASIGPPELGMTAAPEVQLGLAVGASLFRDRLKIGPEVRFEMQVAGANAVSARGMDLELLLGAHALLADTVLVGLGAGTGAFRAAGTPDVRAVVRLAWAPRHETAPEAVAATELPPPDADGDGVPDALDRCPFEPETRNGIRDQDGCPEYQLEQGAPLASLLAPRPSPALPRAIALPAAGSPTDGGAPPAIAVDTDGDGVPDEADLCPLSPEDRDGFEDEDGCPELDNDGDGIPDAKDACPLEAETINGVNDEDGCPDLAPDADGDGVPDAIDRCPLEPETVNGVRDEDGCPEYELPSLSALGRILTPPRPTAVTPGTPAAAAVVDSDKDGIPDEADLCPLTPEDKDGFEDEDGCPEPDNDGDGIPDAVDKCPDAAETFNGSHDDDGCPDEQPDVDGDGVAFENDRCPLEPGSPEDGCPHAPLPALALAGFPGLTPPKTGAVAAKDPATADFDHDGVPDEADACPVTPEDRDGFEDEDGCPEPDNDHDGIPDAVDKCPFEAETINGIKDDDGCPDSGAGAVTVKGGAVVLDGVVRFKPASATLQPVSSPLLKQVAGVLRAASTLSIEIQGHTDDLGNALENIKLSRRRAEAIRAFLVRAGVSANRLVAAGYGPTRPRATNKTAEGREQNRRVEFLILGEAK